MRAGTHLRTFGISRNQSTRRGKLSSTTSRSLRILARSVVGADQTSAIKRRYLSNMR